MFLQRERERDGPGGHCEVKQPSNLGPRGFAAAVELYTGLALVADGRYVLPAS